MLINFRKVERKMADLGVNQSALAERMDVSPQALWYLIQCAKTGRELKPSTVSNLARGLNCPIDDLLSPLPRKAKAKQAQRKAA